MYLVTPGTYEGMPMGDAMAVNLKRLGAGGRAGILYHGVFPLPGTCSSAASGGGLAEWKEAARGTMGLHGTGWRLLAASKTWSRYPDRRAPRRRRRPGARRPYHVRPCGCRPFPGAGTVIPVAGPNPRSSGSSRAGRRRRHPALREARRPRATLDADGIITEPASRARSGHPGHHADDAGNNTNRNSRTPVTVRVTAMAMRKSGILRVIQRGGPPPPRLPRAHGCGLS